MKYWVLGVLCIGGFVMLFSNKTTAKEKEKHTFYDYSFRSLENNEPLPASMFQGKVVLVVNTASKCGFTPQYKELEELYLKYKDRGLVVLGVPSNDFGAQEPGSAKEIQSFCELNYGVSFPMAQKEVVSGKKAHPFYLCAKQTLGVLSAPKWNFHKYLVNKEGGLVDFYVSTTKPTSDKITQKIESLI